MRTKITLACTECKQRNYETTKDKKTMPDRMEIKKYCKFCKTLHLSEIYLYLYRHGTTQVKKTNPKKQKMIQSQKNRAHLVL